MLRDRHCLPLPPSRHLHVHVLLCMLLADPSATASALYVDYRTYRVPPTRVMQSGKSLCTFKYTHTHLSIISALTNFVAKTCARTSTTPQNAFCIHVSPFLRIHISPLTYFTASVGPPSCVSTRLCIVRAVRAHPFRPFL